MLSVARDLGQRGHEVTFLGGSRFRRRIEESGVKFSKLAQCDPGAEDPGSTPGKRRAPRGMARANAALRPLR